tara:strand:- start:721 stop:1143 length:423 start_codon:yes stop_codon:yes gene_type:complete
VATVYIPDSLTLTLGLTVLINLVISTLYLKILMPSVLRSIANKLMKSLEGHLLSQTPAKLDSQFYRTIVKDLLNNPILEFFPSVRQLLIDKPESIRSILTLVGKSGDISAMMEKGKVLAGQMAQKGLNAPPMSNQSVETA